MVEEKFPDDKVDDRADSALDVSSSERSFVALTGAGGFVGSALSRSLRDANFEVIHLVRDSQRVGAGDVYWNPLETDCDLSGVNGAEAVVHLAGESILGLWTAEKKRRIFDSRVRGTQKLVENLLHLERPPRTLICASAVGFYGSRGSEELTEESCSGVGFLADTCKEWEGASASARASGIRVINLRIGVVLDPTGGALKKTLSAFRLGLGGRFGSGAQYMSWITREDLVRLTIFCLRCDSVTGAVNAVAPVPLTNAAYTRKLGAAVNRPTFMNVPEFALRMAPGNFGQEMFLASARVIPARLLAAGFEFTYPDMDQALAGLLLAR